MIEPSIFNEIIRFALGKAYPLEHQVQYSEAELQVLKKMYGKWKWITIILMLPLLTGLLGAYAYSLLYLYTLLYKSILAKTTVLYEVGLGYQIIPAFPLAVATIFPLLTLIQKMFIKDYREFESFYNYMVWKEKKYDHISANTQLPKFFFFISLIPIAIAFTSKLEVTEHELIFKGPFDFNETVIPLSSVNHILTYKGISIDNGKPDTIVHSRIFFKNAEAFKADDFVTEQSDKTSFIKQLSQRSKCKTEDVGIFWD
jgi:hypothetical protein